MKQQRFRLVSADPVANKWPIVANPSRPIEWRFLTPSQTVG